jgi:hypothetical protein
MSLILLKGINKDISRLYIQVVCRFVQDHEALVTELARLAFHHPTTLYRYKLLPTEKKRTEATQIWFRSARFASSLIAFLGLSDSLILRKKVNIVSDLSPEKVLLL